ncbi:MAG TPA: hypothetical protein VKP30_29735 [Polyangiaceae bacterium]|nr:hypothetical protein [Polyangiaceae bacterium]
MALNVLLTIDTEVYPLLPTWREDGLRRDLDRDIYGVTEDGSFGLSHQIAVLNAHGLRAVFFVEGLFASAVGIEPLRRIVGEIVAGGHEVQIHVHPEWLAWMPSPPFEARGRQTLREFSLDEQTELIGTAATNLRAAGAQNLCALRAGDYAANSDTLKALAKLQIRYDTSLNPCSAMSFQDLALGGWRYRTAPEAEVGEVPISFWHRRPFPPRHAQICANSAGELSHAMTEAAMQNRYTFVIVSHSFELLRQRRQNPSHPQADRLVIRRFRQLCEFLARRRDSFHTVGFADLDPSKLAWGTQLEPLKGSIGHTALRLAEQAYRRLPSRLTRQ